MILFSLAASSWRALAQHGFDAPMPAASRRSVAFNNVRRQADSDHLFFWGFLRATSPWRRLSRRGGLSWHPVSPKNRRNRKQVTANCLYDFGKTTLASHPTPAYPIPVTAKSVAGVDQAPNQQKAHQRRHVLMGAFFMPVSFLYGGACGVSSDTPVPFCAGSWSTLTHRLPSGGQVDGDGFLLQQKETRHV